MRAYSVRLPLTSLQKQVGGYMRSDNPRLACKQDHWDFSSRSCGETIGNFLWREIPQAGQARQRGETGQKERTGQNGQTEQTGQTGKTWLTFKLDFPGHFCQRAGFTILAIFGFLVLSFGFKVHLGHVGFLSFTICERKSEAKALLQMCDLLYYS